MGWRGGTVYLEMVLITIVIIVACVVAVAVVCYVIFWYAKCRLSPVQRVHAKVLRKNHLDGGLSCFVTFQTRTGELKLSVPPSEYGKVQELSEGLLVYRGEQYSHFIPGV